MNRLSRWLYLIFFVLLWPGQGWGDVLVAGDCAGGDLGQVRFDGCEGHTCASDEMQGKLERVVRTTIAGPVSEQRVGVAARRLEGLGIFYEVNASCSVGANGKTDLLFQLFSKGVIKELDLEGNVYFYQDDIKKRIFLRPGVLIASDHPDGLEQVRRQEETLVNFYERGGFVDPSVHVDIFPLEGDDLKVVVNIEEGRKKRIERLDIQLTRENPQGLVEQDVALGAWDCPRFSESQLEKAGGLRNLEMYTERGAREAKGQLEEFLQARGIIEPRVEMTYEQDKSFLDVRIRYSHCHRIQFRLRSDPMPGEEGYRYKEEEEWLDLLSFGSSGAFDFGEAEYSRRLLEAELENQGYLFAQVRLDYREVDPRRNTSIPDHSPVRGVSTFLVTQGYVTEIRGVEFPGMLFFDRDKVREELGTKQYDFFGEGGYLQPQLFFAELSELQSRYEDEGFHQQRFVGFDSTDGEYVRTRNRKGKNQFFTYVSGDMGFMARKPQDQNIVYLAAEVEEGPRSRLTQLKLEGCGSACNALRAKMVWKVGDPYSRLYLKRALQKVRSYYEDRGFPKVTLQVACEARKPDVGVGVCDPEQVRSEEVDLTLRVNRGPTVSVGDVFITGNFLTRSPIFSRDLPFIDEPLVLEDLREAERRFRNLGVLNTVRVLPVGLEDEGSKEQLPVAVHVEESSSQFLDFAVGFESLNRVDLSSGQSSRMPSSVSSAVSNGVVLADRSTGYVGSPVPFEVPDLLFVFQTEYSNINLFGNAQEFRFPVKYGVSTTDPLRVIAGAPTWIEKRFLGTDLVFRQTFYGLFDKARNPFDLIESGSQSEVSTALTPNVFFSGRYGLSVSAVRELDVEEPRFGEPTLLNKVSPTLSWQNVDALTHPTRGFGLTGTTSYLNSVDLNEQDVANYLKYRTTGKAFISARKRIILANFLRFGGSFSFEDQLLPDVERFRLGGSKGLRGFADGEVSQYNSDGSLRDADPSTAEFERVDGGDFVLSGTTELRFPLMLDFGPAQLWGAGFFDWGGLTDRLSEFNLRSFRTSAGFGIRLLLYGRVPVRLDYGVKLEQRCKVPGDNEGECLEQETPGELDFNLLYTF